MALSIPHVTTTAQPYSVAPTTASYAQIKPDNYYVSPLEAMNDPALQMLYGGADPFGLSAAQQQQVGGLENYVANQSPADAGMYSVGLNPFSNLGAVASGISGTTDPVAQMGYLHQLAQNQNYASGLSNPYEQNTNYTQQIVGNGNELAGLPTVGYNTQLKLVDHTTGQEIAVPNGFAGLQQARTAAEQLSKDGGKSAYWSLYQAPAGTNDWSSVADDTPDVSGLGMMADFTLPLMAAAIPGLSPLAMAAVAAGGSAASSALQGRSLGDTLKRAAITGGLSFAGGNLFPSAGAPTSVAHELGHAAGAAGGLGGGAAGSVAGGATSGLVGPNTIRVVANSVVPQISGQALAAGVGGGLASGLQNLGGSAPQIGQSSAPQTDPNRTIIVNGPTSAPIPPAAAAIPAVGGLGAIAAGGGGAPTSPTQNAPVNTEDTIYVTHTPQTPVIPTEAVVGAGAIGGGALATGALGGGTPTNTPTDPTDPTKPTGPNNSTLGEISSWLQTLGVLSPVLGSIFDLVKGGGNGNGNGSITNAGNIGALNPIFNGSQLPPPNIAGLTAGAQITPRNMPQQDWNTYAMRPEQSFFNNVPQRYADGGEVSHGRSDDVPALLSHGEYVIDAETMALLGNGDPDAGADKMDQWRVNVRKHKGRELSKGKISPNAKMPADYAGGGLI